MRTETTTMIHREVLLRTATPRRTGKALLPGCLAALLLAMSCTDTGLMKAVEDAERLSDGNLSNYLFAHSIAQIGSTVYLGSKHVWQKTDSSGQWGKIGLPPGLDPDDTPVVSIAADDDQNLFLASSKKAYVRSGTTWSSTVLESPAGFAFYALRAAGTTVLAADKVNTIYQYSGGTWERKLPDTKLNDFTIVGKTFYLASGSKLKKGDSVDNLQDMDNMPNDSKEISNLLAVNFDAIDYLAMLSDGKLYLYRADIDQWEKRGSNSSSNIGMTQAGNNLIIGRAGAGYHIYDLGNKQWKSLASSDGFTDIDSLVTLSSGTSISTLSLYLFLFYDDPNDSNDRIYAAVPGNRGVFGARRKGDRWSWGLE